REAGYGGQVDDVPAPALPHSGQHGVRHLCQPEKIDVQNPVDLRLLALLDCGEVADAGVVHQDVDTAEVLLGATHSLHDLGGVGDVHPQRERAIFMPGDEVFALLEVGGPSPPHDIQNPMFTPTSAITLSIAAWKLGLTVLCHSIDPVLRRLHETHGHNVVALPDGLESYVPNGSGFGIKD